MPKTIPANGVLNAAATPAAAPARISPGWRRGENRPKANITDAPTWTVGPSRPAEAPQSETEQGQQYLADRDAQRDEP